MRVPLEPMLAPGRRQPRERYGNDRYPRCGGGTREQRLRHGTRARGGGGLRASYTGGILNVLLEQRIFFDFVCGISAGSSHSADYLSRDTKRVRGSFVELAASPRFGGLRTLMRGEGYINSSYDYVVHRRRQHAVRLGTRSPPTPHAWPSRPSSATPARRWSGRRMSPRDRQARHLGKPCGLRARGIHDAVPDEAHPRRRQDDARRRPGRGRGTSTHLAEDQGFRRFVVILSQERDTRRSWTSPAKERTLRRVAKNFPFLVDALLTRPVRYNAALAHLRMLEEEGRAADLPRRDAREKRHADYPRLAESYEMGHAQGVRELPRVLDFLFGDGDAGRAAARAVGTVDPVDEAEAVAASFPQEAFDAYQAETRTPELLR